MTVTDLGPDTLAAAMPGRPFRHYPALVSTEAEALAWGRRLAPHGAVVTAGHQAAARGRGGRLWELDPRTDLGWSMVVRAPAHPAAPGRLHLLALLALAEELGPGPELRWPDEAWVGGRRVGAVSVRAGSALPAEATGPSTGRAGDVPAGEGPWSVVSFLASPVPPPAAGLVARVTAAVEAALEDPEPEEATGRYRRRCATLGRRARLRLVPGSGPVAVAEGEALEVREAGTLVVATAEGRLVVEPEAVADVELPD